MLVRLVFVTLVLIAVVLAGSGLPGSTLSWSAAAASSEAEPVAEAGGWPLLLDGTVVLFRHAEAPGTGDPSVFRLDDCATQRNLDEGGRTQARRIGLEFRAHGVVVAAVLSSQWCRAQDTAELAFPGLRRDEPIFNSYFRNTESRQQQTEAARTLIEAWKGPGVLAVFTHQINITDLTDIVPSSGEGVIVRGAAGGRIDVLGRIRP